MKSLMTHFVMRAQKENKTMPKEITNKTEKKIYIKCKKCGDEIFGDTGKRMTDCKCKAIAVDGCEDYVRVIGDKVNYKEILK